MKKITTYHQLSEDEKLIQSISTISDTGKVISQQQYEKGFMMSETMYAYDDKDRLVEETEYITEGGTTTNRYTLNDDDEVIGTQVFYGDDLFEEHKITVAGNQKTKVITQEDKVIQKLVETESEDGTEELLVYDGEGKLLQKQVTIPYADSTEISIFDGAGTFLGLTIESFDENDELKEKKEYDQNKNLIRIDAYTTENDLITEHYIKSKVDNQILEITNVYKYDENENEIGREINNPHGQSMVLESKKYNQDNELIEEIYENLSGNLAYGTSYHKIFVIEQI